MTRPRWGRAGLATAGLVLALAGPVSVPVAGGVADASASRPTCLPGGDAVRAAAAAGNGHARSHGRSIHGDGAADDTPTRSPAQAARDEKAIAAATDARSRSRAAATVEVPVYFSVLRTTAAANSGNYATPANVADTITVLNDSYASAGFHFTNAGVRYRTQNTWYRATPESKADRTMRAALHRGGKNALNIYFVNPADGDTLGWSSFPASNPTRAQLAQDGVAINLATVPGGSLDRFNQGKTAVHEVGHWLYLLHTFEGYGTYSAGGCDSRAGDLVSDTPAEQSPTFGCPTSRNTCPSTGPDPIHNYMDYSDDRCMTEFTGGQTTRMQSAWTTFRAS